MPVKLKPFDSEAASLHSAAESNNASLIKTLLLSQVIDARNDCDRTALHVAAQECEDSSHQEAIQTLLENKADVNALDRRDKTPLHYLVLKPNVEAIEHLLNHGAKIDAKDEAGQTPLFEAVCACDAFENVKLLLERGADVNVANGFFKFTLLHAACTLNPDAEIVKCLIKNGAKVDAADYEGRTALMHLYERSHIAERSKTFKFLIKYSDVNILDSKGRNVLSGLKSDKKAWKVVLEHVAVLQALDLPVHLSLLETILECKEFDEYFKKCTMELLIAKNMKLNNSLVTYFDLLVDCQRKMKKFVGTIRYFRKKHQIYGTRIQKNVEKEIRRREVLDKSCTLLNNCLPVLEKLINRNVLKCLSRRDLLKICGSE